jgi:hypothetical protein
MENMLEMLRVKIPDDQIAEQGKASDYFDIYDNSQNLTEEFLYSHQPITTDIIPIYSTSELAIGYLDNEDVAQQFNIVTGPAIVVARKGYAGRLFVVEDNKFIVHEDAYPIKPKTNYQHKINLWWFVGHYSTSFQADRTSFWGIGDFPRERFRNQDVIIPKISFQNKVAVLYIERINLIREINKFKETFYSKVDELIVNN